MRCQPQVHQGQLAPMLLLARGCQTDGDPFLCGSETWHLLRRCPVPSLSHTSTNSKGGCEVNPVCSTQPYVMQRGRIGNHLPGPFTKPICILRQAVVKLGTAKQKLAGTKGKKHAPAASTSSHIPAFCIAAQQQTIISSNQKLLKLHIFTPTVSQNGS